MSPGLVAGARVLPAAVLRSDVSPLLSAGFRRAASTVVLSGWARVGPAPGPAAPSPGTVALAAVLVVAVALGVGAVPVAVAFAWVFRRTERAADAYAAAVVGGLALARALERLAQRRYVFESPLPRPSRSTRPSATGSTGSGAPGQPERV